ncbi:uncharacterized protein BDR25DRAFT_348317 [Lindgomyces ingoldianus]|uniref:Uncharacterized protein n=1 Tax=Lindgomyces ingoldianus TaxID=673940 RepID=A0ACB6RHP2_9PLEO|nr:uncharacterized protein BDR25DRAFT_348317 [Lindgomyces ingoldianus]KAF2478032.1 hypothetical protein BDR25DRAFT_348317 [Lindgomyces ingoldianus]
MLLERHNTAASPARVSSRTQVPAKILHTTFQRPRDFGPSVNAGSFKRLQRATFSLISSPTQWSFVLCTCNNAGQCLMAICSNFLRVDSPKPWFCVRRVSQTNNHQLQSLHLFFVMHVLAKRVFKLSSSCIFVAQLLLQAVTLTSGVPISYLLSHRHPSIKALYSSCIPGFTCPSSIYRSLPHDFLGYMIHGGMEDIPTPCRILNMNVENDLQMGFKLINGGFFARSHNNHTSSLVSKISQSLDHLVSSEDEGPLNHLPAGTASPFSHSNPYQPQHPLLTHCTTIQVLRDHSIAFLSCYSQLFYYPQKCTGSLKVALLVASVLPPVPPAIDIPEARRSCSVAGLDKYATFFDIRMNYDKITHLFELFFGLRLRVRCPSTILSFVDLKLSCQRPLFWLLGNWSMYISLIRYT